jgi:hypothetical protein
VKLRRFYVQLLCWTLLIALNVQGQKPSPVTIGILDLEISGGEAQFEERAMRELIGAISELGAYDIFPQRRIEGEFKKIKKRFPKHCRDPRCVIEVGGSIGLQRMIYGRLRKEGKGYGVVLHLIEVPSRQELESVRLKSKPGMPLVELFREAIAVLHGQKDEQKVASEIYLGPQFNNMRQLAISTGVCLGAGLFWSVANGGFGGESDRFSHDDRLSGIPTRAYHLPMFARPSAVAHSYFAAADDAYGVMYNPAGMAWLQGRMASMNYQYRYGMDNFSASFVNMATRELGFGQAFLYNGDREGLSTEVIFFSAFAYKFYRLLPFLHPLSVGAGIKVINTRAENPTSTSEYDQKARSFGLGLDIGAILELAENIRYGITLRDAPSVNRYRNITRGCTYFEMNPMTLHMGGLFKVGYSTTLFADGQIPLYTDQKWKMGGGIEQIIFKIINLRGGLRKEIQSKVETPWIITGGFGLDVNTEELFGRMVTIDGSYEYNTLPVFAHVLNFSFVFGF